MRPEKIVPPTSTARKLRLLLPAKPATTNPNASEEIKIAVGDMTGFARKSLKRMAINSLSRTATQKIGNENNRKETNVIE
jgi:hypothetical protein